jgi:hypothetical protein
MQEAVAEVEPAEVSNAGVDIEGEAAEDDHAA